MNLIKRLKNISKDKEIDLGEVLDKYNPLYKKLYNRDYKKFLYESTKKSINILERYYRIYQK